MSKQSFTTGQVLTAAQVNSLQANDFNQTVSVKTANYTLAAADKGTRIEFNTSGSVTCTVNSGLFDAGDTLVIQNRGAGTATITAGTATVNTSASLALAQYSAGTLYFVSDSAAIFFGDAAGISASIVDAKGDLIVGTADNTVGRLAVGTDGYTLVADSVETTGLKWAAPASGGGMTLLASGSHSGTTLTLSSISTSYINLFLILDGIDVSTTSYLLLRFNNDTNANRHRAWDANVDGGTFTQTNGIISGQMNATGSTNSTLISVPNYTNTNSWKFATADSFVINNANTSNWEWRNSKVGYNQTTAITQLDIFESASGSFSCSYKLYGVK